jgi:hypothetical protein
MQVPGLQDQGSNAASKLTIRKAGRFHTGNPSSSVMGVLVVIWAKNPKANRVHVFAFFYLF